MTVMREEVLFTSPLETEGMAHLQGHHKGKHQGQLGGRGSEGKTSARAFTMVFAGRNAESGRAS